MIRKRNIIVFLIITTLSVISLFGIDYYRQTEILYFSVESGFYENEFDLTISGPEGWDIYYTTDSSTPTPNSLKYDGAIHIGDASQNENVYSMIDDISLGYKKQEVTDIIGETPNTVWYQIPDYKVDKCTVIRAIAVGGG